MFLIWMCKLKKALLQAHLNHTQDGIASPNPDYPQEIQVVTGENKINIIGRNLFNKANTIKGRIGASDGNVAVIDGYFTSEFIQVKPSTAYVKNSPTADAYHRVAFYTTNSVSGYISKSEDNAFTTPNNCKYLRFCGIDTEINTTQLEVGSTPTPYKPYQGNTFEINLGVENLLNTSTIQQTTSNGITCTYNMSTQEITFNGTCTTDNTNFNFVGTSINGINGKTTATIFYVGGSISGFCSPRFLDSDFASGINMDILDLNNVKIKSETITTNATLVNNRIRFNNGSIANNFTIKVMISNNPSNTYCKYGTSPIELCKINDYQDYIHRVGADWYIHKEIGKYVANDDLTGNGIATNTVGLLTPTLNITASLGNDDLGAKSKCNLMSTKNINNIISSLSGTTSVNKIRVNLNKNYCTDYATANTFLKNNNMTIYYGLATPNEILITEPSLINQLNALDYDGQSYYDVTNIMTEGQDLAPIITVDALEKIL